MSGSISTSAARGCVHAGIFYTGETVLEDAFLPTKGGFPGGQVFSRSPPPLSKRYPTDRMERKNFGRLGSLSK